jgi:Flp pilus assembly protein TadD
MPSLRSVLALPLLLASGCITPSPPHERARLNNELCTQKLAAGDLEQAEVYCDLGLEFSPQYADLWVNKGLIAMYAGKKSEAKEHFIKAIHYNQEHAAAYMNLGKLYLDEQAYGKAQDNFQRALKVNPDYRQARFNLGLTFIHMNKLDKADKELRTLLAVDPQLLAVDPNLLTVDPNGPRVHHELGIVRYRQDKKEEAVEELTTAARLAPDQDADWWNDLGAVLMELSRFQEARQAFEQCASLNPKHAYCSHNLDIAQRKAEHTP